MNLTPLAAVCRNPLQGIRPADRFPVRIGTPIRDLAPQAEGGLVVCRLNGEWLLREHWGHQIEFGDRVEFYEYPQGRDGIGLLLQVALIASLLIPGGQAFTPYLAAANAAFNILVPPRAPRAPDQLAAPGSIFSASLAGNSARLDQPIWRSVGRVKITPPFAAQPYVEFRASDIANPTVDTDQYYYAVFCLGIGPYAVEKAFIGKTPIAHFKDVIVAQYLAPGVLPSTALANVVTSDEVSALEMPEGRYVGGYIASRPGDTVTSVGIDIAAPQGLGLDVSPLTVEWQVEAREVDDFGRPAGTGEWQIIGTESRTAATNTPQRWTNRYTLATPIRAEVRAVRTNLKNTDPNARDGIQWIGLRAYLEKPAPLNADSSHFEVVMRASDQLSSYSQRDFSMILRALVRTWDPDTGWGAPVFTRNAAWALADLWTNPVWGEGLPDDRVDLQGLWDLAQTLDARQDRFDYAFTSSRDSWEAAQLIAHSARSRAFRRGGVYTLARDELEDVPVTAFTARNTEPRSMLMHTALPRREQPDGVVVEYQSNIAWDLATIDCPCPGFSAREPLDSLGNANPFYDAGKPAMSNPIYIGLEGVTGRFHAMREGIYQAADMALRTTTVEAKVEMEGIIVSFMDPVRWQPQVAGYGQTGDVVTWDEGTFVMELSEPPVFGDDPLVLTLMRDDGTLHDPLAILPGPTANEVYLSDTPDFAITTRDAYRERTRYLLGPLETGDELVKLSAISDGGKDANGSQTFQVEAVVDDERVHAADNALLPGPGEIQDPIDDGSDFDVDEGGSVAIPRFTDHDFFYGNWEPAPVLTYRFEFALNADGSFGWKVFRSLSGIEALFDSGSYPNEWLAFAVEPDQADDFEFYAYEASSTPGIVYAGAALGTWLPSSATRTWSIDSPGAASEIVSTEFRIRVRRIGSTVTQAESRITITLGMIHSTGGGD